MMQSHAPEIGSEVLNAADNDPVTEHGREIAAVSLYGELNMPRSQFACLYTHQKTQKRKVWQDGRLVLQGTRAALHAANVIPGSSDPILDQCEITASETASIAAGRISDLEMDKYLVAIDGPWVSENKNNSEAILPNASASASMQKLLTKKFRKPAQQIPPPRGVGLQDPCRKRQRPLQPGELQKKYYGHLESSRESNCDRRQTTSFSDPVSITQDAGANSKIPSRGFQQAYSPPNAGNEGNGHAQVTGSLPNTRTDRSAPSEACTFTSAHPQSQQAERETIMEQSHQTKSSTTQSNEISDNSGYNPNSFYGEEEEEQDSDNESSPDLFQIPQLHGGTDTFQIPKAFGNSNAFQNPEQNEESNLFQTFEHIGEAKLFKIPERNGKTCTSRPVTFSMPSNNDISTPKSDVADHRGSTLSTSQLLDLFGTGDPTDFSGPGKENGTGSQHKSFEMESNMSGKGTPAISRDENDLHNEDDFQLPSDDSSDDDEE